MAGPLAVVALAASLVAGQVGGDAARPGTGPASPNAPASVPASSPASSPGSGPTSLPASTPIGAPAATVGQPRQAGGSTAGPAVEAEVQSSSELLPILDLSLRATTREGSYWTAALGTEFTSQLLLEPAVMVLLGRGVVTFRVSYAPRLQAIFSGPGSGTYAMQRLNLDLDLQLDPRWTLAMRLAGSYGTQSYVGAAGLPVGTPPGTAPPPTPFPNATSLEYWRAEMLAQLTGRLAPTSTLRLTAALVGQGGINQASQVSMPPQFGPRLDAALELSAGRLDFWTTSAFVWGMKLWRTVPAGDGFLESTRESLVAGVMESWRHRIGTQTELSLGLGGAYGTSESTTVFSYGRFMPTAEVRVQHDVPLEPGVVAAAGEERRPLSRLQFTVSAALSPYVDPYTAVVYDRLVAATAVDWTMGANWRLSGYFSGALDAYRDTVARRYGSATATVGWSPTRFLTVEAGLFAQSQNGVPGVVYAFGEWGGQLGILLHDRLRM